MQKENCEKKEEVKRMNSNKVKNSKRSNTHNEYSKEEMALIDSMSIEEAYRKGLILMNSNNITQNFDITELERYLGSIKYTIPTKSIMDFTT